ncbi:hypothetical protein NIES2130_38945 [Scytonema sp. HK-05]|nr:hypothetical protein NIES2130_38945 [Scytonema sp. HK-05]
MLMLRFLEGVAVLLPLPLPLRPPLPLPLPLRPPLPLPLPLPPPGRNNQITSLLTSPPPPLQPNARMGL